MRKAVAQIVSRDRKRRFCGTILTAMIVVGAIGVAVHNLDDAYLASKFNLVAYVPDRVTSGGPATILVFAVDNDGDPISDKRVDIELEVGGSRSDVWSGRTGSDGSVAPTIDFPAQSGRANLTVSVGTEKVETTTVLDDTVRIIITTDKPIYKPGQTIHMRFLSYAGMDPLPQNSDLLVEVLDPNGDKIFKKVMTPDEYGICAYDLCLSDQLNQGTYTISASSGERTVTKAVMVKEYVLPKFRVDVLGLEDWYRVDNSMTGTVSAEYFFGEIVRGTVQIEASVYLGIWEPYFQTSGTLVDGEFIFSIYPVGYAVGLESAGDNGYVQVNITVIDTAGHEEKRYEVIPIAPSGVVLSVLSDSCLEGEESTFYVIARTPGGVPLEDAIVTTWLYDGNSRRTVGPVYTDDRGIAKVVFTYDGEDRAVFRAVYNSGSDSVEVGIEGTEGLKVVADKSAYEVGDLATFDIVYSGDSMTNNVYWDLVSRGYVVDRGVIPLTDGRATLETIMVPEVEPLAQLRAYKIEQDMGIVRDAVTFSVGSSPALTIDIWADNDSYYPRDDVNLYFQITDMGSPVMAALGVSVVDEAVYEVGSLFQGFEELIFGLDEEFVIPQYQIINYIYTGEGSLPSESLEVVSEMDDARVTSTWLANVELAEDLKLDATRGFWFSLYLCVAVGLMAYAGSRVRKVRTGRTLGLTLIVVASLLVAGSAAAVYVMVLGFGGTSSSSPPPFLVPRAPNDDLFLEMGADDGGLGDFDAAYDQSPDSTAGDSVSRPSIVRQYFPETWYWNPCLLTDETGYANITLTAPDSITSWQVDVIASTSDGMIGTESESVKVFQPFFVEPDIPVSVVRGDEFPMSMMVYNYLDTEQTVTVNLTQDPWFTLLSSTSQSLVVPSKTVSSIDFVIVADKVGWHTVTVHATSEEASDAVVRPIEIVPDGRQTETLFNGEVGNGSVTETLILEPDRIEGSENAWVKLQGGVDAVLLEGVDEFIRHVSGCGEQSLSMLSIDILAYDTVVKIGGTPEKMFEYESVVNQGIQHELMYLVEPNNDIGRGIVWFPGDQDVHPWLTSWGLIAFQDAINAGFGLDEDIIEDMQDWLMSIQNDDGSWEFPDWGIYEFNNPILKAKEIAATGYIGRALLHSGVPGSDTHIQAAVDYVESHITDVSDDAYSLSLSLLLLQGGSGSTTTRDYIAERLEALKTGDGDNCYWSSDVNLISDAGYSWSGYSPRVIETTGYAAMALNGEAGHWESVNGAMKYLLDNREALGGWMSTQNTVVAFHALAEISSGSMVEDVIVEVSAEGLLVDTVHMDDFNKDVTFLIDLRPYLENLTDVSISCTGEGAVLYSIYLEQYVPWPDEPESSEYLTLTVTYDTTSISVDDRLEAHMYLLYDGVAPVLKMVLVDLRAPLGFAFDLSEFDALRASGVISSYDNNDRQVVVYITDIVSGEPVEFDYSLVAQMPITSTLQGVVAWDMYDPLNLRSETLPIAFEAL